MTLIVTVGRLVPRLVSAAAVLAASVAAQAANLSPGEQVLATAAEQGRYTFILFSRDDDAATQAMQQTVAATLETQTGQATWVKVRVNDPAEKELVRRFDAGRSPLPTVMALAPNGAVTGVYPLQVDPQAIENSILTPQYAEMVKGLQSQKIALVCLMPSGGGAIPKGIVDFENDPHFKGRTQRIIARSDDPAEARFFERMKVSRDLARPAVIFFAPPGVYLGTFDATVTREQLSKVIHDAGRCGPNCKHNH